MAMGERKEDRQQAVFVSTSELRSAGHPFYRAVNEILRDAEFDRFAEQQCRKFYAEKGRPSIAPGVNFRMLMVGYFEGGSSGTRVEGWSPDDPDREEIEAAETSSRGA